MKSSIAIDVPERLGYRLKRADPFIRTAYARAYRVALNVFYRLGVRDATQEKADALVHGVIASYDADVPVSFSANPQQAVTARRHLQLTIEVEILDQSNGHVLYSNKALRGEADYAERAEQEGRTQAIAKIVQTIVEGVQSKW